MSDRNPNAGQADFNRFVENTVSPNMARYGFGMLLDYNIQYEHLTDVINKNDLLILPYETLKNAPGTFLKIILQRLDTPEERIKIICDATAGTKTNVRSGQGNKSWKLREKPSRFKKRLIPQWLLKKRTQKIELSQDIKKLINRAYSNGNQKLAAKTDLDIDKYGYINFE